MALTASVVIPARDAAEHLPSLLDGLAAQRRAPLEVLLVDDGSHDDTARLASDAAVISAVLPGRGEGPGAARNLGAARARGDVLAFTDADCRPHPDWLAAGLAAIEGGADLVQGAVTPFDGVLVGPWDRTIRVTAMTGLFETANLLIRRELFERLGGFERWLSPRRSKELAEDVWLGWRASRLGATVCFVPESVVEHAVFPRGPGGFLAERARVRYFPAIAGRVPELRSGFLYRRWFLTRRSASFDLALAGLLLGRRRPALALAALPYARVVWRDVRGEGVRVAGVRAAADGVTAGALAAGSIAARSAVL